jgi:DNA excision repair protein ERCC-1
LCLFALFSIILHHVLFIVFQHSETVLTNVRSVNKTDVVTLLEVFGSFGGICQADEQQLVLCPGLGDKKVKRLYQALHEPFKPKAAGKKARTEASASTAAAVRDYETEASREQSM